MRTRKSRVFSCDFETTVYDNQDFTEVWASACVELFTEDVHILHSIGDTFKFFRGMNCNVIAYYHNLKFDGSFWIDYLITDLKFKQATLDTEDCEFLKPKDMPRNTFTYSISSMGQWYRIIIKVDNHIIELRDSMKLLPFSVKRIGDSFRTKHRKLDMEYKGFRYAGCEITPEERKYIANDVLVVKEALEIMYEQGHKRLTIGSCCLAEYKESIGGKTYDRYFPQLYDIQIDESFGSPTAGDYINLSYHGGWCYVNKGKERQVYTNGVTLDVNSLYPSMMSSESGNYYPIGEPTFWQGNYIPSEARDGFHYYFVRFKTKFYIKPKHLPFVQIKKTMMYKPNEMLESSEVFNPKDGKHYDCYYNLDGELVSSRQELTMTMTDFALFREHYELVDFEILDGCYFKSAIGIFDKYIEKYKKIKTESEGAVRELAKLFLNNLYGKLASSTVSNFKVAFLKDDGVIGFWTQLANDKTAGYIACGSAITSYARNFTIRAAQKNYDSFCYADTDSIHCACNEEDIVGVKIHPKNFCAWKCEAHWNYGKFIRQKTYVEHVTETDKGKCEPYYNLKCAGMPERSKKLFLKSIGEKIDIEAQNKQEQEFLQKARSIDDFDIGLSVAGKLLPKRIKGGIVLVDTMFQIR